MGALASTEVDCTVVTRRIKCAVKFASKQHKREANSSCFFFLLARAPYVVLFNLKPLIFE